MKHRVHCVQIEDEQQVVVYKVASNMFAKHLWRTAVEHHGFFRSASFVSFSFDVVSQCQRLHR